MADPLPAPDVREDVALALLHAPRACREALGALFALDARLGAIVRATREPMLGQMRLTWWQEALTALDTRAAPAEPLLQRLAAGVVGHHGIAGRDLAALVDGWEVLLDGEVLDETALLDFAARRGGRLFALVARVLGVDEGVERVGEGWALADLAMHWSDLATAERAALLAGERLTWRGLRGRAKALAMLARFAAADLRARSVPPTTGRLRRLVGRVIGR